MFGVTKNIVGLWTIQALSKNKSLLYRVNTATNVEQVLMDGIIFCNGEYFWGICFVVWQDGDTACIALKWFMFCWCNMVWWGQSWGPSCCRRVSTRFVGWYMIGTETTAGQISYNTCWAHFTLTYISTYCRLNVPPIYFE